MKRLILMTVLAALVAPVTVSAGRGDQALTPAQRDCTVLKAQMGATAFAQAYATFGKCVSAFVQLEQVNAASAQAACVAERVDPNFAATHGGKTFAQFYGTGPSGKNAFGRCVSAKTRASAQAEQQGRMNPARACQAQRTQMGAAAFANLYGTTENKANAFGTCVSRVARQQLTNEMAAATSCRAEQDDPNFPATHEGKTFAQFYGTNADLSNAFGECVSKHARQTSTAQSQATISAAKACQAELKAGAAAFEQRYGTFGKCVSLKTSGK